MFKLTSVFNLIVVPAEITSYTSVHSRENMMGINCPGIILIPHSIQKLCLWAWMSNLPHCQKVQVISSPVSQAELSQRAPKNGHIVSVTTITVNVSGEQHVNTRMSAKYGGMHSKKDCKSLPSNGHFKPSSGLNKYRYIM